MAKGKSLLLGFLAGGIISGAVALFNAPKSGKETRADLKKQAVELKVSLEHVKENGKELSEQIINTSKEGVQLIKELSLDVKDSLESWHATIQPHQKNIQYYLKQIEERLNELENQTTTVETD